MTKKVLMVASHGGHYDQIQMIKSGLYNQDISIITIKSPINDNDQKTPHYYIPDGPSIGKYRFFYFVKIFFYYVIIITILYKYYTKVKPDVVINNGCIMGLICIIYGKIFRKRTIYIESLTRVDDLSVTGKLAYLIVDKMVVQWKKLLLKYPRAEYWGSLI